MALVSSFDSDPGSFVSRSRFDRERQARKEAEALIEQKSRELYNLYNQLQDALTRERQLAQLQSEFVTRLFMDFRTPLTIIDGAAVRILKIIPPEDIPYVEAKCKAVRDAVTRLTELLESFPVSSEISKLKEKC